MFIKFFHLYFLLFSEFRMPRKYIHTTDRGKTPTDILQRAVKLVIAEKQSLRSIAKQFGMCHVTFSR